MKRRAHVECLGFDRIRVTTFCQQKEFELGKLIGCHLDLITLKPVQDRGDFFLDVWEGNGTISEPYQLVAFRRNYDNGRLEDLEPWLNIKTCREATFEATIWDGDKRPGL